MGQVRRGELGEVGMSLWGGFFVRVRGERREGCDALLLELPRPEI